MFGKVGREGTAREQRLITTCRAVRERAEGETPFARWERGNHVGMPELAHLLCLSIPLSPAFPGEKPSFGGAIVCSPLNSLRGCLVLDLKGCMHLWEQVCAAALPRFITDVHLTGQCWLKCDDRPPNLPLFPSYSWQQAHSLHSLHSASIVATRNGEERLWGLVFVCRRSSLVLVST